jgi:1,4-alpha-glucan branching enzyme
MHTLPSASPVLEKTFTGLGAVRLKEGGVGFRVWAPNADTVSVVGSFNNWDATTHPLARDESGNWSGIVTEAKPGDEYRYSIRRGENEFTRVDPRALRVTNSVGNGILWWPEPGASGPRFQLPSQNEMIIYELHTGTYNAIRGKNPGTFDTLIAKLPHLVELGVNVIEVMPITEFAGDFSWGYNPAHPFAVESAYGGPEKFQALVKAAHEHGIGVILDVVYNHFGPSDLSLWQFDGWSENNGGGIYFYNDGRAKTPWGDTRPDYGRGEVRSYIRDNALMWLRDFGVDGLRWDMSVYIRTVNGNHQDPTDEIKEGWTLMQWIHDDIQKEFPGAFTIAEDLSNSEWLVRGTDGGGAGFNAQWDAAFVHPVRGILIAVDDAQRDLNAVVGALKCCYDGDAFKRVIYSESHDEVANGKARLPSEIDPAGPGSYPAKKRSLLGAALTLIAPGVPMLYQGQEFLEDEWFRDSVPVDWAKKEHFAGIYQAYRDLIALRLNKQGFSKGLTGAHIETHHVDHDRKIMAIHRRDDGGPGDDVIVVINLSHTPVDECVVGVPSAGTWHVRFNSDSTHYSGDFQNHRAPDFNPLAEPADGLGFRILTGLAPYSILILSQDAVGK